MLFYGNFNSKLLLMLMNANLQISKSQNEGVIMIIMLMISSHCCCLSIQHSTVAVFAKTCPSASLREKLKIKYKLQ